MQRFKVIPLAAVVAALAIAACADNQSTSPKNSVVAGLVRGDANDTTVGTPPAETTPGAFHGFVVGHGTGIDTIATAPRLAGATITAYPHLGFNGETPLTGDAVATVTTDANGFFQFPEMAGGAYVVTIRPPANSGYRGQYALATISNISNSGNWWVVLSKE